MAEEKGPKQHSAMAAILGWGGLAAFAIAFTWLIMNQLGQEWHKKEPEAIKLAQQFKPTGNETLSDLTKLYSLNAREKGCYVGEFQWLATQQDGPKYQVQLYWTDEGHRRTGIYLVDLEREEVRPQGEISALPQWAREGKCEKS